MWTWRGLKDSPVGGLSQWRHVAVGPELHVSVNAGSGEHGANLT